MKWQDHIKKRLLNRDYIEEAIMVQMAKNNFTYQLTSNKNAKKLGPEPNKTRTTVIAYLSKYIRFDMQAVALAAPQLGYDYQAFVVRQQRDIGGFYINPVILERSKEMITDMEGCRSLPNDGMYEVERHKSVKLQYEDISGNEHVKTFHGYAARIVQHEMDHLRGVMIDDDQT